MSVVIRNADLARDRAKLEGFILGSNNYEAAFESDRRLDAEVGADFLPILIERVASRQGRILVAEIEGTPVGWAVCYVDPHDAYVKEEERPCGYVAELFVDEAHRGRHLGRDLLAACENHFRALGIKSVLIGALSPNTRAVNAYRAAGYADYAINLRKKI
jgi:ribosomal protein S18 acetylase RimI-like enzyme